MKINWKVIIIILLCIPAYICTFGLIVMINDDDKKSETNTDEFEATLTKVNVIESEGEIEVSIITDEFNALLTVDCPVTENVANHFRALKAGKTVYFRIDDVWSEQIDDIQFVSIVALQTDNRDILTLSDYNKMIAPEVNKVRLMIGVFLTLALGTAVAWGVTILKRKRNNTGP